MEPEKKEAEIYTQVKNIDQKTIDNSSNKTLEVHTEGDIYQSFGLIPEGPKIDSNIDIGKTLFNGTTNAWVSSVIPIVNTLLFTTTTNTLLYTPTTTTDSLFSKTTNHLTEILYLLKLDSTRRILYILWHLDYAHNSLISILGNIDRGNSHALLRRLIRCFANIRLLDRQRLEGKRYIAFVRQIKGVGNLSKVKIYLMSEGLKEVLQPIMIEFESKLDQTFVLKVQKFGRDFEKYKQLTPLDKVEVQANSNYAGTCGYCTNLVHKTAKYKVMGKKVYHRDCWVNM